MRTYCASTLPFSAFDLTAFVGELSEGGMSAIELAHPHFSDVEAETIDTLREETGLNFKSMLSTVRVDAPDGLEALIAILDTAQRLPFQSSASRVEAMKPPLLARLTRLLITLKQSPKKHKLVI